LPSYYSKFGGLIFSAALDKYMYIAVNRPIVDDLVRVKYSASETVAQTSKLQHELARTVLQHLGFPNAIEIISMADIPAGTGLGSSSCYVVGLLTALYALKRDYRSVKEIAETACHLEINILGKPIGKQDQYVAAYGGLPILEIAPDGLVRVKQARVDTSVLDELNRNTLVFYTGTSRQADAILSEQDASVQKNVKEVTESLHRIKELGYEIIEAIEGGNIDRFGLLMDEHWEVKKTLSSQIANSHHHHLYKVAKENGALGGKITGAGGGGFFVFYTNNRHRQLRRAMLAEGLRELRYRFDMEGSKILVNFADGRTRHDRMEKEAEIRSHDLGISGTC
ncbi:MAG: galactokinase, partial [Deltaproteobacteria bacterium]|nr:galactokinase [Deltaproteobacteria bacterium]